MTISTVYVIHFLAQLALLMGAGLVVHLLYMSHLKKELNGAEFIASLVWIVFCVGLAFYIGVA